MPTTCTHTVMVFDPEAGEVHHRCGLSPDHTSPHMCFYCGHGWDE